MTKVTLDSAHHSAKHGGAIHKWAENKVAMADLQVLTYESLYYNLHDDEVVMVEGMCYDMHSPSHVCQFDIITTAGKAGAGAATQKTMKRRIINGADTYTPSQHVRFVPPIPVTYEAGVTECIAMRTHPDSEGAEFSCGWQGFRDLTAPTPWV